MISADPIADNPFYVLGLPATCSRMEVEREGQKLLAMLDLDLVAARWYETPLGPRPRDGELVRHAMAELRDPQRRLVHELWARLAIDAAADDARPEDEGDGAPDATWPGALVELGWQRRGSGA